jgi:F-type H+-transporting ATPase subunit delta
MAKPSAKRYALALYQMAQEKSLVEKWHEQLKSCESILEDDDFSGFLLMPKVSLESKMNVVRQIVPDMDLMVYNMVGLLVSRDSADSLSAITGEYEKLLDRQNGIERAHVKSAIALDESSKKSLVDQISRIIGKNVEFTAEVDPSIVGGLVARIGDKIMDGSVKTRLRNLRKSLVEDSL